MKYLFVIAIAISLIQCSPKLAPDAYWGRSRWVLVEMKGVPVQQSGGRRDAYIEFDTEQKLFTGNGGCNQINGSYTLDKNSVQFRDVNSTKMLCGDMEFEKVFLAELANVNRYEIRGEDIVLKKKKNVVLVLRARRY